MMRCSLSAKPYLAMVMMTVSLLGAVPAAEGRKCTNTDVDYASTSIASDCTVLTMFTGRHHNRGQDLKQRPTGIGDLGASIIAKALKGNTGLAELGMSNDNIGDIGAIALAEALEGNTALTWLELGNNVIGDNGAIAIARMLKSNSALATLYLYTNDIGDRGATAIAEALKGNSVLTTLNLMSNHNIDSSIVASIEAFVAENNDPAMRATKVAEMNDPSSSRAMQVAKAAEERTKAEKEERNEL